MPWESLCGKLKVIKLGIRELIWHKELCVKGADFTMSAEDVQIQEVQRHLSNIEREIAELKRLITVPREGESMGPEKLEILRQRLINEGFDEELVPLVGTIPLREEVYKEEIREAISERLRSKP